MHLDKLQRRASDIVGHTPPTILDTWDILIEVRNRLEDIEDKQNLSDTAFTKNDLGKPDYEGHRAALHKTLKAQMLMEDYKVTATKKVLGVVVIFFLGILASGFMVTVTGHIK